MFDEFIVWALERHLDLDDDDDDDALEFYDEIVEDADGRAFL